MSVKLPFLRTPYNYDTGKAGDESGLACLDPSRTSQAFKDDADINVIVERFGIGYDMPEGVEAPTYGDYTGVTDFFSAANAIAKANEAFDALHANVRSRFQNDPGAFVAFCSDEANRAEAERLGLVFPKPTIPGLAPAASGAVSGPPGAIPPPAAAGGSGGEQSST